MALAPPWGGPEARSNRGHPEVPDRNAPNPLSAEGLALLDTAIGAAAAFVHQVYVPDVRLLAGAYPEWGRIGAGPGGYLSWGDLPESDEIDGPRYLPAGRLVGGNLVRVNPADPDAVGESVIHAWYTDDVDPGDLRIPAQGQTTPAFDAPCRWATCRWTAATRGSRPRATTASRWRRGRSPGCSSGTRTGATR